MRVLGPTQLLQLVLSREHSSREIVYASSQRAVPPVVFRPRPARLRRRDALDPELVHIQNSQQMRDKSSVVFVVLDRVRAHHREHSDERE